jgi:hypothetical protein
MEEIQQVKQQRENIAIDGGGNPVTKQKGVSKPQRVQEGNTKQ